LDRLDGVVTASIYLKEWQLAPGPVLNFRSTLDLSTSQVMRQQTGYGKNVFVCVVRHAFHRADGSKSWLGQRGAS